MIKILGITDPRKQMKTIRFLKRVRAFKDIDGKKRGPYKPDDVLRIHIDTANLLILKGKAKDFDLD
jgi:hypothetical protein